MGVEFKVVTLKPLNVGSIGWVEAGVDVTDQLGDFRHLASLVDMGDVALIPNGEVPVARAFTIAAPAADQSYLADQGDGVEWPRVGGVLSCDEVEAASLIASGLAAAVPAMAEAVIASEEGVVEEPVAEDVAEEEALQYMDDPSGFTIEEVLAYAESHPEHASMLLELETEGKGRKRIIKALTALSES